MPKLYLFSDLRNSTYNKKDNRNLEKRNSFFYNFFLSFKFKVAFICAICEAVGVACFKLVLFFIFIQGPIYINLEQAHNF